MAFEPTKCFQRTQHQQDTIAHASAPTSSCTRVRACARAKVHTGVYALVHKRMRAWCTSDQLTSVRFALTPARERLHCSLVHLLLRGSSLSEQLLRGGRRRDLRSSHIAFRHPCTLRFVILAAFRHVYTLRFVEVCRRSARCVPTWRAHQHKPTSTAVSTARPSQGPVSSGRHELQRHSSECTGEKLHVATDGRGPWTVANFADSRDPRIRI
eukprot:6180182-Pleurochrysis_carterae.AAC.3